MERSVGVKTRSGDRKATERRQLPPPSASTSASVCPSGRPPHQRSRAWRNRLSGSVAFGNSTQSPGPYEMGPNSVATRRVRDARSREGRPPYRDSHRAWPSPPADPHADILIRQQRLPASPRVARIGRDDIGTVDLTRPVVAFEPHHLIRPVSAVEHSPPARQSRSMSFSQAATTAQSPARAARGRRRRLLGAARPRAGGWIARSAGAGQGMRFFLLVDR
jgi:hypothetical protein